MGLTTLRGHGPAPYGYHTCRDSKCPAQRCPFTGRFQRIPNHYHPLSPPMQALQHHVTGAVERGEAEPITEMRGDTDD